MGFFTRNRAQLALVDVNHAPCVGKQRRHVARYEVLAFAQSNQKR